MIPKRPDITQLNPQVRTYIEALEAEIERLRSQKTRKSTTSSSWSEESELTELANPDYIEPAEAPTPGNVITATASGFAKRTPRHLYNRQHRGGMGVFDIETADDQPPALVTLADENQNLLLLTNLGRAFRLPVSQIPEAPVRARGQHIVPKFNLLENEHLTAFLPEQAQGYLALVSQSGMVRLLRHHIFGDSMRPGTAIYDYKNFGPLAGACWTPGDGELFIATRHGRAIRFSEKLVAPQGSQGIRLEAQDRAVGIAAVYSNSAIFMLGADGRGAIRIMEGFSANKAPGAGGKIAINNDSLVSVLNVDEQDDIFILSRLSKIIRFRIDQIPPKDSVVQGVICITLRADEPVAAAIGPGASSR
jgi:DNA gyrase subunit A